MQPSPAEWQATSVAAVLIESASAKVMDEGVSDLEADFALPVWAGVLPVASLAPAGPPIPDARLADGQPVPEYIQRYRRTDPKGRS